MLRPKSATFSTPFSVSSRFSGLRSRWMNPFACMYWKKSNTGRITCATASRSAYRPWRCSFLYTSPPAAYSIASTTFCPSANAAYSGTAFGCLRHPCSATSRCTCSTLIALSSYQWYTLSATFTPVARQHALYTQLCRPPPQLRKIWKPGRAHFVLWRMDVGHRGAMIGPSMCRDWSVAVRCGMSLWLIELVSCETAAHSSSTIAISSLSYSCARFFARAANRA
mmetsp:Transcript_17116/g.43779  ORF Transcript_17116/g.43779 Transcript_17116/m.43779 type:complete len:224 (-) Transcript_17116:126-797(-)